METLLKNTKPDETIPVRRVGAGYTDKSANEVAKIIQSRVNMYFAKQGRRAIRFDMTIRLYCEILRLFEAAAQNTVVYF